MKKFRGGLYADLGNYKTTLPNTEILNNFFALNPVGYRSGGMVKGVSGGNPTGMPVTGGFLANAQKYQFGGSSYYNPSELVAKNIASKTRPGNFRAQGNQRRLDIRKKIDDFRNTKEGMYARYINDPGVLEQLSKDLNIPIQDIKATFQSYSDPVETYKGEKAYKGEKGKSIKKDPDRPSTMQVDDQVSTGLEQLEGDESGSFMSKEKPVEKEPFVSQNPEYIQQMIDAGITSLGDSNTDEIKKFQKNQKMKKNLIDINEIDTLNKKEQKIINNSKNNESSVVDTINNEAGSDNAFSEEKDTIKNLRSDLKKVMDGRKEVSTKDSSELNKLIKNMYGGEGKEDAPAWAMPLMVAGFTMAASDNPDMLGAAAEGGIAGVDAYVKAENQKKQDMKDQLDAYLKVEDIDIRKEQMDLSNEQFYTGLEINTNATIAQLEATISNQNLNRELAYKEMYQKWEIHEANLMFKYDSLEWDKLSETMKMKHNALLGNAQILKLHAESEALGLKKPTYDTFNIDGKDVRVAITQKEDGTYDILEIGQPSSATTVLKAFMDTFGTTIIEKIQDDEFDSNEWSIMYDEFKKMVNSEDIGTLNQPKDKKDESGG
jgi:hypothetical protein